MIGGFVRVRFGASRAILDLPVLAPKRGGLTPKVPLPARETSAARDPIIVCISDMKSKRIGKALLDPPACTPNGVSA